MKISDKYVREKGKNNITPWH